MIVEWIRLHETLIGYLGILSLITFFLTLLLVPILVIRMPADYFLYDRKDLKQFRRQHPFVRVITTIIKNIFGGIFICAGLAMLVLPGQGIITILIGITLISFPKKRAIECRIIELRAVVRTINWMRTRADKPPLELPRCEEHGLASRETARTPQTTLNPDSSERMRQR
jgi:hypothetical protein